MDDTIRVSVAFTRSGSGGGSTLSGGLGGSRRGSRRSSIVRGRIGVRVTVFDGTDAGISTLGDLFGVDVWM